MGKVIDDSKGGSFVSYGFDCPAEVGHPAELLGDIYYSDRWPIGSWRPRENLVGRGPDLNRRPLLPEAIARWANSRDRSVLDIAARQ